MRVYDVMTKNAECVRPDASIQEAASKMKTLDVGSLPVCGNDDRLAGIVTDRDIAIRSVSEGHDPTRDRVRNVMSQGIVFCFDDQDVSEAAEMMREHQIRRLPVLNREKHLVGIVSLGDLAVESGDEEMTGQALEGISEPARPNR